MSLFVHCNGFFFFLFLFKFIGVLFQYFFHSVCDFYELMASCWIEPFLES
jgi:hypothetical protein